MREVLLKALVRCANYGETVTTVTAFVEDVESVKRMGIIVDMPKHNNADSGAVRKNPIEITLSWGDVDTGVAKKLVHKVERHCYDSADKARTMMRKKAREAKYKLREANYAEWTDLSDMRDCETCCYAEQCGATNFEDGCDYYDPIED